jgi:hypothetical protein
MALTRKNLTLDADRLRTLAERRGASESAAAREAIDEALFADEFVDIVRQLQAAGFAVEEAGPAADAERQPRQGVRARWGRRVMVRQSFRPPCGGRAGC